MLVEIEKNQQTVEALRTAIQLLDFFELEAKIASNTKRKNIQVVVSALNKDFTNIHSEYLQSKKTLQGILNKL